MRKENEYLNSMTLINYVYFLSMVIETMNNIRWMLQFRLTCLKARRHDNMSTHFDVINSNSEEKDEQSID